MVLHRLSACGCCRQLCPGDKNDAHFSMRPYHRESALQISELYHEVVTYAQNRKKVGVKPLLSSERAALSESGLTTGRLAQNSCATLADNNGLGVREDGGDGEASGALDVHEEGAGSGDQSLEIDAVSDRVGLSRMQGVVP